MSYITLDGFTVPGRFLYGDGIGNRAGVRTSPSKERPFVFAKVDEEGILASSYLNGAMLLSYIFSRHYRDGCGSQTTRHDHFTHTTNQTNWWPYAKHPQADSESHER